MPHIPYTKGHRFGGDPRESAGNGGEGRSKGVWGFCPVKTPGWRRTSSHNNTMGGGASQSTQKRSGENERSVRADRQREGVVLKLSS